MCVCVCVCVCVRERETVCVCDFFFMPYCILKCLGVPCEPKF